MEGDTNLEFVLRRKGRLCWLNHKVPAAWVHRRGKLLPPRRPHRPRRPTAGGTQALHAQAL